MKKTIRLAGRVEPVRDARGRRTGSFTARFKSISTLSPHESAVSAIAELADRISARCEDQSSTVKIIRVRDHVGVFSYDVQGYVQEQHSFPDGHVSLSVGGKSIEEEEDSFRLHVAQLTWDGTLRESCDILPDSKQKEFRDWVAFQLAYRHASNALGMDQTAGHRWACNHIKEFSTVAA